MQSVPKQVHLLPSCPWHAALCQLVVPWLLGLPQPPWSSPSVVTPFLQMGSPGRSSAATYQPVSCLLLSPLYQLQSDCLKTKIGMFHFLCWDHVADWIKYEFFRWRIVEKIVLLWVENLTLLLGRTELESLLCCSPCTFG